MSLVTGRFPLYVVLMFMLSAAIPCSVNAENIFLKDGSIFPDVRILSQDDGSVLVSGSDGVRKKINRTDILRINSIELAPKKSYVFMRQTRYYGPWKDFYAYLVDKNESVYTFRDELYRPQEYTLKKTDILFVAPKTIAELKSEGKIKDEISFDLSSTIALMGSLTGLIFAFLLFKINRGNRRANRVLGIFMVVESMLNTTGTYNTTDIFFSFPYLLNFHGPLANLPAPFLLWYVRTLAEPEFRLKPVHVLHLLPFAIVAFCLYSLIPFINTEQKMLLHYYYIPHFVDMLYWHSYLPQVSIYMIPIIRGLHEHRRRIKNEFSTIDDISLTWLVFFTYSLIAAFTILLLCFYLDFQNKTFLMTNVYMSKIWPCMMSFYLLIIGYKGLAQHEIFSGTEIIPVDENDNTLEKYSIPPEKIRESMDRVARVMKEKKPYLDPGLTLPMLAEMAEVPRNTLSQAINESTGQNFYDYVNAFRIETVKEYLKNPEKQDMNILHIAMDAGFNTKATFNASFKKYTGLTPGEFRKTYCNE